MKPLRIAALVAALVALAVIGIRPSWRVGGTAHDAVLMTAGAERGSSQRLADSLGGAPLFVSLANALAHRDGMRHLHVVGWGLDADDWVRLESIPVTFDPAPLPAGFVRASWPAHIVLGDRLTVDGMLSGRRGSRIELVDPTGVVDSSAVDSGGAFHLETQPRAQGQILYTVRVRGAAVAETLGVDVAAPPVWRVLVLESAPRPETTVLRDWLARRGGTVAVRSTVSRDRVHREFVNRPSTSLDVVTGPLLAQFDIVMIDGRTLSGLGAQERGALHRSVDVDGLGVLLVPDTVRSDLFLDFAEQRRGDLEERLVRPVWHDRGAREPLPPAVAAEPYALLDRYGAATLIGDGFGHALAQVAPRGAGRVTLSLITGTARWRRSGLSDTYATYWSRLLAATAAPSRDAPRWSIASPGPWNTHRPVALEATTEGPLTTALVTGPAGTVDTVFLARDASGRWRGIYWPRTPGWHAIAGAGGPAFYVQSAGSWVGVRAERRLAASLEASVTAERGERVTASALIVPARPVPLGWAFALFLGAAGYLWSERRRLIPTPGSRADTAT
jgi:hypothetical protein